MRDQELDPRFQEDRRAPDDREKVAPASASGTANAWDARIGRIADLGGLSPLARSRRVLLVVVGSILGVWLAAYGVQVKHESYPAKFVIHGRGWRPPPLTPEQEAERQRRWREGPDGKVEVLAFGEVPLYEVEGKNGGPHSSDIRDWLAFLKSVGGGVAGGLLAFVLAGGYARRWRKAVASWRVPSWMWRPGYVLAGVVFAGMFVGFLFALKGLQIDLKPGVPKPGDFGEKHEATVDVSITTVGIPLYQTGGTFEELRRLVWQLGFALPVGGSLFGGACGFCIYRRISKRKNKELRSASGGEPVKGDSLTNPQPLA